MDVFTFYFASRDLTADTRNKLLPPGAILYTVCLGERYFFTDLVFNYIIEL